MILLIDNYDSFTFNLVHRIGEQDASCEIRVVRNDQLTVEQAVEMGPSHIIISPGPCTPNEAGISVELVKAVAGKIPLLGVCLGHQSIGAAFGMEVVRNWRLMHGKTSEVHHNCKGVFVDMPTPQVVTRYHSLVIKPESFDSTRFEKTAWTDEGEIMGMRAREGVFGSAPLEGVQFHPESFMTPLGSQMIARFLGL